MDFLKYILTWFFALTLRQSKMSLFIDNCDEEPCSEKENEKKSDDSNQEDSEKDEATVDETDGKSNEPQDPGSSVVTSTPLVVDKKADDFEDECRKIEEICRTLREDKSLDIPSPPDD